MNKEFEWNDELIMEYARHVAHVYSKSEVWSEDYTAEKQEMNLFKASKQPKPEWEILEGKGQTGIHQWYYSYKDRDNCEMKGCTIHKVKRLSDGELFTVGDEVFLRYAIPGGAKIGKIERFYVKEDHMKVLGSLAFGPYDFDLCDLGKSMPERSIPVSLTPTQLEKLYQLLK